MSLLFCSVRVVPVEGTGTTCVFPFIARGVTYHKCVALIPGNNSLVCGTVSDAIEWGICIPGEWTSLHCLYCKFETLPNEYNTHCGYDSNILPWALRNLYGPKTKIGKRNYKQVLRISCTVVISNIYAPILVNILFATNKYISLIIECKYLKIE